jgi:hypothetical protein
LLCAKWPELPGRSSLTRWIAPGSHFERGPDVGL